MSANPLQLPLLIRWVAAAAEALLWLLRRRTVLMIMAAALTRTAMGPATPMMRRFPPFLAPPPRTIVAEGMRRGCRPPLRAAEAVGIIIGASRAPSSLAAAEKAGAVAAPTTMVPRLRQLPSWRPPSLTSCGSNAPSPIMYICKQIEEGQPPCPFLLAHRRTPLGRAARPPPPSPPPSPLCSSARRP